MDETLNFAETGLFRVVVSNCPTARLALIDWYIFYKAVAPTSGGGPDLPAK
jgi:hypothetical protein